MEEKNNTPAGSAAGEAVSAEAEARDAEAAEVEGAKAEAEGAEFGGANEAEAQMAAEVSFAAAMLGMLFYHDPTSPDAQPARSWLSSHDAPASWPCAQPEAASAIRTMADALTHDEASAHLEFNRLFIGPARLPAPPWASVYTDPDSVIYGNETLAVRDWMRAHGVAMNLSEREPEDHFGLMLMMLSWGLQHSVPLDEAMGFVEQHVLPWSGRFLELLASGTTHPLYQSAAQLAADTLEAWRSAFALTPPARRLYR